MDYTPQLISGLACVHSRESTQGFCADFACGKRRSVTPELAAHVYVQFTAQIKSTQSSVAVPLGIFHNALKKTDFKDEFILRLKRVFIKRCPEGPERGFTLASSHYAAVQSALFIYLFLHLNFLCERHCSALHLPIMFRDQRR